MNNYIFTKDWFSSSELKNRILEFINTNEKNKILEIGSYEGKSTVFLADTLLNNPESFLIAVDPFLNIKDNDHNYILDKQTEQIFIDNIKKSNNSDKIKHYRISSNDFFKNNKETYNLIYIDGSHLIEQILLDIKNSINIIEKNGIIWIDDYRGGVGGNQYKSDIDIFLKDYLRFFEIIIDGYQLAIKRII